MVRVTAAVLVKDGKLLIAKRKPTLKLANRWELPGGKVEDGETPEACLRREMKEEFDIEVSVGEFLGSTVHHYPFGTIELMGYRACHLSGALRPVDHSQIRWVTADQLTGFLFTPADVPIVRRIESGEIPIQGACEPSGGRTMDAHGSRENWMHAQTVHANGIDIAYDAFGDPAGRPLVMIMGLVSQMIGWPDAFCRMLAEFGHYVVRFDNRDVGLSTKLAHLGVPDLDRLAADMAAGLPAGIPYTLSDMAADTRGLIEALDLGPAHVCGISMGGMIAQVMAIEHPTATRSIVCLETSTGERDLPTATPEAAAALMSAPPVRREDYLDYILSVYRAFAGGSDRFDADLQRTISAAAYDRMWYPMGFARQMAAIMTAPGRRRALRDVRVPALVVHGDRDPLIPADHGRDIAAAVPGAELLVIEGLGHGICYPSVWPQVAGAIDAHLRSCR